jgi:hypothetical protein
MNSTSLLPVQDPNANYSNSTSSDAPNYGWTTRIEKVLDMVRVNCSTLSDYHSYKYQQYKKRLTYFRIPLIVFSAINAFAAVGLQPYMKQHSISTMNSVISLFCGVLTSIELFLNIQKKMESELSSHKDYYILSVQIFKVISMERSQRKMDGRAFLDSKFSEYEKLVQNSNVSTNDFTDDMFSQSTLFLENRNVDINENSNVFLNKLPNIPNMVYSSIHHIYNPKLHIIKQKRKAAIKSYESFYIDEYDNKNEEDNNFAIDINTSPKRRPKFFQNVMMQKRDIPVKESSVLFESLPGIEEKKNIREEKSGEDLSGEEAL